ncbi:MAG: glycosyltransferase [Clostridium sp.]|nr:glycosyltransferase [Acetatifactor muris]MCM1526405.1 glycosyltransferase [Bacteroides sp.]MCM1563232.1 glycosyltransferase [Clostridium sp.]
MKILMLTWKSFGNEDIIAAFRKLRHQVVELPFSDKGERTDEELQGDLDARIRAESPDFLFSFNYFPVAAKACKNSGIPYVSWIYDSPYVRMYHYSVNFPTNHVFVFDRQQYLEFHNAGIETVHYLPMAANPERLNAMNDLAGFQKTPWYNRHEVAFIGSLYTEKHQFFQRMDKISPYTRGYLEGLMAAQKQVYGYNFIQELLSADIISDMQNSLPLQPGADSVESIEWLFAQYVINRQITAMERQELLSSVAERFSLDLYTPDKTLRLKGCTNHGPVDYYDYAPYVFKRAKINLNISLRSILSGIPLRAFDIMGAGGFLLTNYQSDFGDCFVPDEDFVYYESKKDLLDKIDYYLRHEDERAQIAQNGLRRISADHTYVHRVNEILSYL